MKSNSLVQKEADTLFRTDTGCDRSESVIGVGTSNTRPKDGYTTAIPSERSDKQQRTIAIIGNMNVGKTTLFEKISGADITSMNVPGSTVSLSMSRIKEKTIQLIDTPGTYSVLSNNEEERISRDVLLSLNKDHNIDGAIHVADAKNLKRSIALVLEYAEYGIPMLLDINMADDMASHGIEIDYHKLSNILGIDVCVSIATEGIGVKEIESKLESMRIPNRIMQYSTGIKEFIDITRKILSDNAGSIPPQGIALLLLAKDQCVEKHIGAVYGERIRSRLTSLAREYREEDTGNVGIRLIRLYNRKAQEIVDEVQTVKRPLETPLVVRFGDYCTRLSTGIPIAVAVVALMYLFVGSFGATFLVDKVNALLLRGLLIPFTDEIVALIPNAFIRDMLIDRDFGILPSGIFLALGLVLPVLFCFYLFFGLLEDSGYFPRISFLLAKVFKIIGLNGKGVMPLTMGFSCVTMAILTTRMLDTKKERIVATFLLLLGFPCAPLIAVMFVLFDKMPVRAVFALLAIIFAQIVLAGVVVGRIVPGNRSPLIMEIPAMRIPSPFHIIRKASYRTYFFIKEAIPVFVLASCVVFIFNRLGGLAMLEDSLRPLMNGFLGLPEKSVQVFIKTMIRRENGATELIHLSSGFTNLQLIVSLFVMVNLVPCINSLLVIIKERGFGVASAIVTSILVYAIVAGGVLNHICLFLGITFS